MGGFLFLFYFIFLSVFGWMEKKINGGAYMFGHDSCLTMFGHMVEETRQLGSCLELCSFHHVKREGIKLAHSLARRAILFADLDVWVEELPEDLDAVFQGDLAV